MGLVTGIVYPNDGDRIKVANYNTPIQAILAQLNGNVDNSNISGIDGSKVAAGTLPFSALKTDVFPGWISGQMPNPNTVTYLGNRSYSMVFNGVDLSSYVSPGHRIRTTRTVVAPNQSTSLNGSTQYWNNTSPNKMTFTDDFAVSAWVKLTSYADGAIVSRYNGTSGWELLVTVAGVVTLRGFNGGSSNIKGVASYQAIPLNKWVHIAAQVDMNTATLTPTTNYIMFDGTDVPANIQQSGTNPTALIQAGNLEVGSRNAGTLPFPGKIAQVAIFNAKVGQSQIQSYLSQGLVGAETSLASAYSFSGNANDLFTTTPNNLTAQGAAVATNADSPFGTQGNGSISTTLDYGIVQSVTFSTNTTLVVQASEGNTIPTSGTIAAIAYSGNKVPYGFPEDPNKWTILTLLRTQYSTAATVGTWYNLTGHTLNVPAGVWNLGYGISGIAFGTSGVISAVTTLSTTNNGSTDVEYEKGSYGSAITSLALSGEKTRTRSISTNTPYYLNAKLVTATGSPSLYNMDTSPVTILATNAFL